MLNLPNIDTLGDNFIWFHVEAFHMKSSIVFGDES